MSWTRRCVFKWHLTVRMRTFFSFRVTLSAIHPMHLHWSRCSRDSLCVSPKSSHPRTMPLLVLLSSLRSLLSLLRLRQHGRRWLESDFTPVRLRSGVDRLAIWLTRPQTRFFANRARTTCVCPNSRKNEQWLWKVVLFTVRDDSLSQSPKSIFIGFSRFFLQVELARLVCVSKQ